MTFPSAHPAERHHLEGVRKQALETGRNRLMVAAVVMTMAFGAIGARLVDLTVLNSGSEPSRASVSTSDGSIVSRADILDRNGIVLATSLPTASLYADPERILDPVEAADELIRVLPDLDRNTVLEKLTSKGRFQWVARNLTPQQKFDVNRLGLPGISFQAGERRIYPHGRLASHILGLTTVDGEGVAGIERSFDQSLRSGGGAVKLSVDIRVQSILEQELNATVEEFSALGAAGVVMDVNTGEIIAMASYPDYDPNDPVGVSGEAGFNRATKGVYEMGSTFKLFTAAMALDSGAVNLSSRYDARQPIKISRFRISDYHAKNSWLSVPEIILHSSNIGSAKMAMDVGTEGQQDYLRRFGLLNAASLELPEVGRPLVPSTWRPINTMTISYGHGIAVSPVQLTNGISALVNGGIKRPSTLVKVNGAPRSGERVMSAKTSEQMRGLMRLVVSAGTGRKADVPGYLIGGKTGTADKQKGRGYDRSQRIASFVGAFPMSNPRYTVLVAVDEPHGTKKTFNYATGGWVAAPVVGKIVSRMGPVVGIIPDLEATFETPPIPDQKKRKTKSRQVRSKPIRNPSTYLKRASYSRQKPVNSAILATQKRPTLLRVSRTTPEQDVASN
jgi:cell division protein FtsI (penicillin-binding protein 3)